MAKTRGTSSRAASLASSQQGRARVPDRRRPPRRVRGRSAFARSGRIMTPRPNCACFEGRGPAGHHSLLQLQQRCEAVSKRVTTGSNLPRGAFLSPASVWPPDEHSAPSRPRPTPGSRERSSWGPDQEPLLPGAFGFRPGTRKWIKHWLPGSQCSWWTTPLVGRRERTWDVQLPPVLLV